MIAEDNCKILNKTKGKLPSLPFVPIKNAILGKEYDLSIACVSPLQSRKLNRSFRKIDSPTNILSFPLSKTSGEIVFQLDKVRKDAKNFDLTYPKFLKLLVIHGLLHLKGFEHSSIMEREEKKFLKRFS